MSWRIVPLNVSGPGITAQMGEGKNVGGLDSHQRQMYCNLVHPVLTHILHQ